jgi:hypothetical protein
MRAAKSVALAILGLALLWSAPAVSAPTDGEADGWYKWQIDGNMTTGSSCCNGQTCDLDSGHGIVISSSPCKGNSGSATLYVRKDSGQPTRIRVFDSSCRVSSSERITDMGSLSQDDGVAILLDIVQERNTEMEVREEALFWLAQSNSDTAFEYFDRLLSDS